MFTTFALDTAFKYKKVKETIYPRTETALSFVGSIRMEVATKKSLPEYRVNRLLSIKNDFDKYIFISHFFVNEKFRNKGLGKELFKESLKKYSTKNSIISFCIQPSFNNKMNLKQLCCWYLNQLKELGFYKIKIRPCIICNKVDYYALTAIAN